MYYFPMSESEYKQPLYQFYYMEAPPKTLTKRREKKLDDNFTKMLRAILISNIPRNTSCTDTCLLSLKQSK